MYEWMSLGQHVNSGLIQGDIPFSEWIFQAVTILTYVYIRAPKCIAVFIPLTAATTLVVKDLPILCNFME